MYTLALEGDMARVSKPDFDRIRILLKENKIPILWLAWETRRCYVRIKGVMVAQGWLIEVGPMDYFAERKVLFLPD